MTTDINKEDTMAFNDLIHEERIRQINMGYTAEHDKKGGIRHLVNLAIDLIYKDEKIKAAAVVLAILQLYRTLNERKWFLIGVLTGAVATAILVLAMGIIFLNAIK